MTLSSFDTSSFSAIVLIDNENILICGCCENVIDDDNLNTVADDDRVCEDCFDNEYTRCDLTGEFYPNDDITRTGRFSAYHLSTEVIDRLCGVGRWNAVSINVATELLDDYNFYSCNDCDDYFPEDDMRNTANGSSICNKCYSEDYFECQHCNEVFHTDYYNDGSCESCYRENNDDPDSCDLIKNYSYDVLDDLNFLGNCPDNIYFGIELETQSKSGNLRENADKVLTLLGGYALLKSDSSIGYGFEVVTAPATLDIHLEQLAKLADNKPHGLTSWESGDCGMHIHVSRKPLSQLTIGKILVLINDPSNRDFITAIAGRSESTWCELAKKKITDCKRADRRYEAINLLNSQTIEFRIFRGTLEKIHLLANIEFVHAVVYYCLDASMQKLHYHDFLSWVLKQPRYKNLHKFLENKGY
jgi:hypothetical protein